MQLRCRRGNQSPYPSAWLGSGFPGPERSSSSPLNPGAFDAGEPLEAAARRAAIRRHAELGPLLTNP